MTARLQFGLLKQMLGKIEYGIEHGSYETNLNNLILGITGLEDNERRNDWRHISSTKLIQVATEQIMFQEEVNLFLNRSNVDFFNFVSTEVAASSFYRLDTGRWIRLRLSRLWVQFEARQILGETGLISGKRRKPSGYTDRGGFTVELAVQSISNTQRRLSGYPKPNERSGSTA